MPNNFRTFYLYSISLITLIMIIGGIVATVNNTTSYFFPDSYIFFQDEVDDLEKDSDSNYDVTNNYEIRRENYKNGKIKNIVVSTVVIAIGGIMYKYHWNIIEKERIK